MTNKILQETSLGANSSTLKWIEANASVVNYKFAKGSSTQLNATLTEGIEQAYTRYLRSVANPHLNIRASKVRGSEYLDDYVDDYNVGHIYLVESGCDLVQVQLLDWATTAMNSNLIEEIKSVYGKYLNALQAKRQGKRK